MRSVASGRRALLLRTLPVVGALVMAKLVIEQLEWEFIVVSPLHTSIEELTESFLEMDRLGVPLRTTSPGSSRSRRSSSAT